MHVKFLLFSCLVFLVALVYFIYTSFTLRTLTEERKATIQESKENFNQHIPRVDSSESDQNQLFSHEEERVEGMLEQTDLGSLEETQDAGFVPIPEMEFNGTEIDSGIDPELEMLFVVVNEWRDKNVAHGELTAPLMREYAELGHAEGDLILAIDGTSGEETQRLYEELRQVQSEKENIANLLEPYDREMERNTQKLERYLETNYGLTIHSFFESYRGEFDSWRQAQ